MRIVKCFCVLGPGRQPVGAILFRRHPAARQLVGCRFSSAGEAAVAEGPIADNLVWLVSCAAGSNPKRFFLREGGDDAETVRPQNIRSLFAKGP
jgi:hypothetical protein